MRTPFVAGNWKMNHLSQDAVRFGQTLSAAAGFWHDVEVAIFPPATLLMLMDRVLSGTGVRLGGQDCHQDASGAFTGAVSAAMLANAGCAHVLVGHSERRRLFGDTDDVVGLKLRSALEAGLDPVLCVGETESERDEGRTEEVLARQLVVMAGLAPEDAARVTVAYEPVWAIGTGRTSTPEHAQQAHEFLRRRVATISSEDIALSMRILHGGSVTPSNFAELLDQPDVDGGLVGGASLEADRFLALISIACGERPPDRS